VREFLSSKGIYYEERNVEDSKEIKEEMMDRTGQEVVPALLTQNNDVVLGYDEERLREIYG
jgi:glutaredoxin